MKYLMSFSVLVATATMFFAVALTDPSRVAVSSDSLAYPEYVAVAHKPETVPLCPKTVTVAVIDTGIDYTHPELTDHLWHNGLDPANGEDDDQNGYIDDDLGFDFVHDVRLPYDTHGHGTHIAGIVAGYAEGNYTPNAYDDVHSPLLSCKPNVKIMALKYYDNNGAGYNNLKNTVRSIEYAIANGADIINYSGGGADPSASEQKALARADKHGILIVSAAGNDGRNNDRRPYYPANYGFKNGISVGSVNKFGRLLPSSNFGLTVDVAAQGLMILSTVPNGKHGTMSGTSQATALVSGLAASIMSLRLDSTAAEVKDAIIKGSTPLPFRGLLKGGIIAPENSVRIFVSKVSP
jgi:subtilisin family serine protease